MTTRRRLAILASLVLPLVLSPSSLIAQCPGVSTVTVTSTTTVTANICMRVQDVLQLTSSSTLSSVGALNSSNFSANAAAPAAATYVPYGGSVALTVAANRAFEVSVTGSFAGPAAKSDSSALWSVTSGDFSNRARNVSVSNVASNRVIPFPARAANAPVSTNVYLASRWNYEVDKPGSYTLTLTFTLSAK